MKSIREQVYGDICTTLNKKSTPGNIMWVNIIRQAESSLYYHLLRKKADEMSQIYHIKRRVKEYNKEL